MAKTNSSKNVVDRLVSAKSPAEKSAATRLLNKYISERQQAGLNPNLVRAAIKGSVTKRGVQS